MNTYTPVKFKEDEEYMEKCENPVEPKLTT
jgi:hypothetical protein